MTHKDIIKKVYDILNPVVLSDIQIWDIEIVKEGAAIYLRVYIDKDKGVSIKDCEYISKHLSKELDILDPIESPYILEVSSAGINRALKKDSHFEQYIGHMVDIKLYKPIGKTKQIQGILSKHENNILTITDNKTTHKFDKKDIAVCKLAVVF